MNEKGIDGITIDYDTADRITVANLVDYYITNMGTIKKLSDKKQLSSAQQSDLDDAYEACRYLKKVISYYTTPDQYENLLGEIKDTDPNSNPL